MAVKSSTDVRVSITQPAEASQGAELVLQATQMVIRNKEEHQWARGFQAGAKALRKKVIEHYAAIKGPLNAARTNVLDMEKRDLAPIDQAIAIAERIDTGYVREQQRIEAEAAEAIRLEAEAKELKRRQKEADAAEAAALKLEASSNVLSEREQVFVARVIISNQSIPAMIAAAKHAGYKDPEAALSRLLKSDKINKAIANAQKAKQLREQVAEKQAAPLTVDVVTKPSEIVEGGMRTYYACKDFDLKPLLEKLAATDYAVNQSLREDVTRFLEPALLTLMSAQARGLKELFTQVWPMCRLDKCDGTVGR